METNLLDKMLSAYMIQKTPVTIFLQNKNRITGKISMFDSYVVIMENQKNEIVYRHAISSILPALHAAHARVPGEKAVELAKPVPKSASTAATYPKRSTAKDRPARFAPKAAATSAAPDHGLSNSMKEGLLRWMQEQKAGK